MRSQRPGKTQAAYLITLCEHSTRLCGTDLLCVPREQVTTVLVDDRLPILLSTSEFILGDLDFDEVLREVDVEDVSVLDEGDGRAIEGLRAEVTHGQAARCARETSIRDNSGVRDPFMISVTR